MYKLQTKICGITGLANARQAINFGSNALGFVFYLKSKRYISFIKARNIICNLPPFISTVGLIVNPSIETISKLLQDVKIDYLQFHGNESASFCESIAKKHNQKYIKAIALGNSATTSSEFVANINNYKNASAILFDTKTDDFGGSGNNFPWHLHYENLRCLSKENSVPILIAGGVNATNLNSAYEIFKTIPSFAGFDLSSGVETAPGIKSKKLMQEFFINLAKLN